MIIKIRKRFFAALLACALIIGTLFAVNAVETRSKFAESGRAEQANEQFSIIMYHQVTDDSKLLSRYAVSSAELENDFKYIKEHGYTAITMTELIDYALADGKMPNKPIMITFDDGYESFYTTVTPMLEKYDLKAVVSIIGSATDLFTEVSDHHLGYSHMNWQMIEELSKNPRVEVQNHSYDMHRTDKGRNGCKRNKGEQQADYEKSLSADLGKLQQLIKEHTGKEPNTMTFPYGSFGNDSVEIAKKMGFKAVLTCREKPNKLRKGGDWLYSLGRYNRPSGRSTEEFFAAALAE